MDNAKTIELSAIIQEIRDRVRSRHPNGNAAGGVPIPDLLPLLHARDAAEGKVASIGTVNPRAPGLMNDIVQTVKRIVSRALDWHVREQVEFNRAMVNCVQSAVEALNETNRAISILAGRVEEATRASAAGIDEVHRSIQGEVRELKDIRQHWAQWRPEWEKKLAATEIQFLRALSDLQGAWQHRVTLLDESHREQTRAQMQVLHADYQTALTRTAEEIQKRFWDDLDKIRTEYESLIHTELRLARQKATLTRAGMEAVRSAAETIDWLKFGEKFRGSPEYVKRHLGLYVERFAESERVIDLGCGRGELLEVLQDANIPAIGIDLNDDCLAVCRSKGLQVEKADLFQYLDQQPDGSLTGVVSLQVVEHLPSQRLPEFIALVHAKLRAGAMLALETPNPECLAIFARHFYLDPTHTKPVPHALLAFYLEEAGFGRLETRLLEPAIESIPSLAALPEDFRKDFFGYLDYAIFGRKL